MSKTATAPTHWGAREQQCFQLAGGSSDFGGPISPAGAGLSAERVSDWLSSCAPRDGRLLASVLAACAVSETETSALEGQLHTLLELSSAELIGDDAISYLRDLSRERLPSTLLEQVDCPGGSDRIMCSTFRYRLRSGFSGIAANLTAKANCLGLPAQRSIRIHGNVWLSLPLDGLYWKDVAWLTFGLSLHAEALASLNRDGVEISVVSLQAPMSDFRSEVAALVMDGWVRQEFNLPAVGVRAEFDSDAGQFVFHWGDVSSPFADPLKYQ